jgi:DNA replication initiation complex subunit (GINS family)
MTDHYTQLLEWRRTEAAVRGLAKLPHDFYRTTTAYLAEVRRSYESELRENPSGRKGEISRQTYQRASQVARDIAEARTQKVLAIAFQSSIGGAPDLPNALPEERSLFDALLGALRDHRRAVTPYLETAAPGPASRGSGEPTTGAPEPVARATPPAAASPAARGAKAPAPLTYVRVLAGGRRIAVGPETIDLREDDVLSLPADSAKLLLDAKVVEPVRTGPDFPVT